MKQDIAVYTASGTNTYTVAFSPTLVAHVTNQVYHILFTNANSGASTLNPDGAGTKAITKAGTTALVTGDINAGQILQLMYDGTQYQIIGDGGGGSVEVDILTIGIDITGQGNILVAGELEGVSIVPFTGTIIGWYMYETSTTPIATTTEIDVWKDNYGAYPPLVAGSIWGTKPKLTTASKNTATGLSIAVTQYDVLKYKLVSNDLAKNIKLGLIIQKA